MDQTRTVQESDQKGRNYGLEERGMYYSTYRGTIVDNKDPKKLGRVKVRVPQVAADNIIEEWAWPFGQPAGENFGDFFIPPKGSPVWVQFEQGRPTNPVWTGGHWANKNGVVPEEGAGNPKNRVRRSENWTMEMDDEGNKFKFKNIASGDYHEIDGANGDFNMSMGRHVTMDIGENKTENIGGDKGENITGDKNQTVGGNKSQIITGDSTEDVTGHKGITSDTFGITANSGTFSFGGVQFTMGLNSLTISVGGSSIVINAGGVTIMGRDFLTHHHKDVLPGPGNTGDVL
jgi:uncharacterized protein involved in type VI secretion and phage assembly